MKSFQEISSVEAAFKTKYGGEKIFDGVIFHLTQRSLRSFSRVLSFLFFSFYYAY
jgi:hypothetical protein